MEKVTYREVFEFYENNVKNTIKNKEKLANFEMNKSIYIRYISDVLNGKIPLEHRYNIFLIYEPKPRLIMSLKICDKIINHNFTTKYLIPKLDRKLDDRNVATRVGKGTDYALKLLRNYIEYYKRRNEKIYVLKIDISKFFYTIDHNILKSMLKSDLNYDEYIFVSNIIDSTNYDYINKQISGITDKYNIDLPYYNYGKGLPIGNLSSQMLSVYYLNRLDHYIIHNLKLKHYIRYMDDFIILSSNKNYLKECMNIIINKLSFEYKLNINTKKTFITSINNGVSFLGYRFLIKNNRTIMLVKSSSISNMKKKIKLKNNLYKNGYISFDKYFASLSNYYFSYRGSMKKINNIVDGLL